MIKHEREPGELIGKTIGITILGLTILFLVLFVVGAAWEIATGGTDDGVTPTTEPFSCASARDPVECYEATGAISP